MLLDSKMLLGPQRYYIAAAVLFVIWSTLFLNSSLRRPTEPSIVACKSQTYIPGGHQEPDELRDALATVFKSIKIHPTKPHFRDSKGKVFTGSTGNSSTWSQPLGQKVLIVDIDTRVPTGDNQILHPESKIDWETLQSNGGGLVSHAITNHYLYAMIHGYEYRYYEAQNMPDHHTTWIKPHVLKELLPNYQFVVAMDADAIISHLEIPLEWMFNRWGIETHTSMALPHDTEEFRDGKSASLDSKGVPVLNTGTIICQNNELTFEMLEAWGNCTTEVRYPGCARWKGEWSHEQRAFSEYVRYDFGKIPGTIVGIPCDDAVGYPNFKEHNGLDSDGNAKLSDCNGNLVRHYTLGKDQVHEAGAVTMAQALVEVVQKSILSKQDQVIVKEPDASKKVAWEEQRVPKQAWEDMEGDEKDDEERLLLPDLQDLSDPAEEEEEERKISLLLASKVS